MSDATKKLSIELFQNNKKVTPITITEYIDWIDNSNKYDEILELPPIQRGFVWKPKQIQDLWDSMLRDMPIGCVMLQKFDKNEKILTGDVNRKVIESTKPGYFLMDGQQRSLAMRLGFAKKNIAHHKLWIDFNSNGVNGCLFQFRVTTKTQPFGYSNNGTRLSLHERRNAWEHWVNEYHIKEEDLFEKIKPWKASDKHGEYIFEVNSLWQGVDELEEWKKNHFSNYHNYKVEVKDKINEFYDGLCKLKEQWLALILIPKYTQGEELKDIGHDSLTMLFERISSSGTRLTPEDLLFSMIKQAWPEAHNLVEDIQENVGSLMKPTEYVLTAFRLSALLTEKSKKISDNPRPDAKYFHRHLYDLLGTDEKKGELRKLINKSENSALTSAFRLLLVIVKYRKKLKPGDHGIPKTMFPELGVPLIQIILFWIINNKIDDKGINQSRNEIIRFVLFWKLCSKSVGEQENGSAIVIKKLKDKCEKFPGKCLYDLLTNKNEDGYSVFLSLLDTGKIRTISDPSTLSRPEERAKKYFGEESKLYEKFSRNICLLIWLQREYIATEFGAFNPIAGQDQETVPYDYDHIVPQSNWSSLTGIQNRDNVKNNKKSFEDLWVRRELGNSIGNYRILNASDNRSRGDEPLVDGLLKYEKSKYIHQDEWKKYCFLPDNDEEEVQLWREASPSRESCLIWDDYRVETFQSAVELRVIQLYKSYIENSKLSEWL